MKAKHYIMIIIAAIVVIVIQQVRFNRIVDVAVVTSEQQMDTFGLLTVFGCMRIHELAEAGLKEKDFSFTDADTTAKECMKWTDKLGIRMANTQKTTRYILDMYSKNILIK